MSDAGTPPLLRKQVLAILKESLQIQAFRIRQRLRWLVFVRLRELIGRLCIYLGLALTFLNRQQRGLSLMLRGRRGMEGDTLDAAIWMRMQPGSVGALVPVPVSSLTFEQIASRLIILKLPRVQGGQPVERGVLLVKFGVTLEQLHHLIDKDLLRRWFTFVIEPSWVGIAAPEVLCWQGTEEYPTVVFTPFEADERFIANGAPGWQTCTLGPGDWVDPGVFHIEPDTSKFYDALYVANFTSHKRIDRFLEACARLTRQYPDYRAALVCAGYGRGSSDAMAVENMIRRAESAGWLAYFPGVDRPTLNRLFNQSRVNVLVSLKEGANRALCEGLMAGVPALLIKENMGGNHRHITAQTGRVVPDAGLEDALLWFREHHATLTPREWAMANTAPEVSTARLEALIRETELRAGRAWTEGLLVKVNDPELRYVDGSNGWLRAVMPDLLRSLCVGSSDAAMIALLEKFQSGHAALAVAGR